MFVSERAFLFFSAFFLFFSYPVLFCPKITKKKKQKEKPMNLPNTSADFSFSILVANGSLNKEWRLGIVGISKIFLLFIE